MNTSSLPYYQYSFQYVHYFLVHFDGELSLKFESFGDPYGLDLDHPRSHKRAAIGDIPVKRSKEAFEGKIVNSLGKAMVGSQRFEVGSDGFWMILVAFELRMVETSKPKLCIGELPEWSIFLFSVRFASIFLRFWRSYSCYDMPATSSKLLPLRICKPIFSGQKSTTSFPYPATIVGFRMRPCLICGPFRATSKNCLIRGLFKQTGPALGGVHGNPMESNYPWPALSRKMPSLLRCSDT